MNKKSDDGTRIANLFKGSAPSVFEKAKYLRKETTDAEKELWYVLRNKKINKNKFRRQHPFSCYIADFYCHERKLVIEIDGDYHSEEEQKELDKLRTKVINEFGVKVIRFSNKEILNNIIIVREKIIKALQETPPLQMERG
jgi:cyclase